MEHSDGGPLTNGNCVPCDEKNYAIQLIDVEKHFGQTEVLKSICLNLERGGIFALLGPSGCSKTTLIRVIVGRLHPDSGNVIVLGKPPHCYDHHVPGKLIGYMPQELALYRECTITEQLFFYGRLADMNKTKIKQRIKFLTHLLDLPYHNQMIMTLSGGQQRRISFAVALIHEPKLLILDEPTVGVDPVLRKKIWNHLIEITLKSDVTALLTTHYVEEARQATLVSFMRRGQLLETGKPDELMHKYEQQTLEGVFLELSEERDHNDVNQNYSHQTKKASVPFIRRLKRCSESLLRTCHRKLSVKNKCSIGTRTCCNRSFARSLGALLIKDVIKFQRNPLMLIIQFIVPVIQISLFCLSVGRKLTGLPVAFVSREFDQFGTATETILLKADRTVFNIIEYDSLIKAQQSLDRGRVFGVIDIGGNFTKELFQKSSNW
ncbi:unnamed protein product [Didymodactylos carnosus]|uniref:ABC transporter domain-containing protein n=1 Tax=Didymodactylos carnosus TaxID=1234261 RepID=A0A815S256_9BILA|nr:unnamed protein product [Didymodactylos carnosus]CAF4348305.1 unnamed protein product [Didymodactylos carnosus]